MKTLSGSNPIFWLYIHEKTILKVLTGEISEYIRFLQYSGSFAAQRFEERAFADSSDQLSALRLKSVEN